MKKEKNNFKKRILKIWKGYSFFILLAATFVVLLTVGIAEKFYRETGSFSKKEHTSNKIALISIKGVILSSEDLVEYLDEIEKNDEIVGLILRINSPGGAVAPVQEIYEKLLRIRETKTIYSSISSLAASGGYYIASASDKIFANKGSIVGSIGVIFQYFRYDGLMQKIGVSAVVIKSGEHKDIFSSYRAMSEEEREIIQDLVDESHQQFVSDVSQGRGVAYEDVASVADGRIFSGKKAKQYGLIDKIGDLDAAIEGIKKSLNLDAIEIVHPPQKWIDKYFDGFVNSSFFQTLQMSLLPRGLVAISPL